MKTKRKTKRNKKHPANASASAGKYPAWVLAVLLASVLLLEGALFTMPASADWTEAAQLLNASDQISGLRITDYALFQPVADVIVGVNVFYITAADQMFYLLEGEVFPEAGEVVSAVGEFYAAATVEMANLLDMSGSEAWPSRVAGVSISK